MHAQRRRVRFEHRRIIGRDGTILACQCAGALEAWDFKDKPRDRSNKGHPLMLTNGLGGSYVVWRPFLAALDHGWRALSWDYRGLYRSGPPAQPDALDIPTHADDLEAVRQAYQIDRLVLIGWSMGVQVNFEYYRRYPDRVQAIICMNGVAGRPFDSAFGTSVVRHGIPALLALVQKQSGLTRALVHQATGWSGLVPALERMGFCSPTLDRSAFDELVRDFRKLDFARYARMFEFLGRHDARDLLSSVQVPVLILSSDRDQQTPAATAEAMAQALPHARLHIIPGGTHYAPLEYPAVVAEKVQEFLHKIDGRHSNVPVRSTLAREK